MLPGLAGVYENAYLLKNEPPAPAKQTEIGLDQFESISSQRRTFQSSVCSSVQQATLTMVVAYYRLTSLQQGMDALLTLSSPRHIKTLGSHRMLR